MILILIRLITSDEWTKNQRYLSPFLLILILFSLVTFLSLYLTFLFLKALNLPIFKLLFRDHLLLHDLKSLCLKVHQFYSAILNFQCWGLTQSNFLIQANWLSFKYCQVHHSNRCFDLEVDHYQLMLFFILLFHVLIALQVSRFHDWLLDYFVSFLCSESQFHNLKFFTVAYQ